MHEGVGISLIITRDTYLGEGLCHYSLAAAFSVAVFDFNG